MVYVITGVLLYIVGAIFTGMIAQCAIWDGDLVLGPDEDASQARMCLLLIVWPLLLLYLTGLAVWLFFTEWVPWVLRNAARRK